MALSDIDKIKLTIGLKGGAEGLLSDDDLSYFLEINNNDINKTCISVAHAILFQLSAFVHERSGVELEIWGHTWFENYLKALKEFINSPNSKLGINQIQVYAGGIDVVDIRQNIHNPNNHVVRVDSGIPTGNNIPQGFNTNTDVFDVGVSPNRDYATASGYATASIDVPQNEVSQNEVSQNV